MSFQPFVVQCLTCGSQLRVTDPAIVGTIAACPKCNSMVQIEPAGHQVAVGGSSIDSQAITEEAISPTEGASLGSVDSTTSGFVGDVAEGRGLADSQTSPIPPPWQSDRTQRSRQIALVVAVSLTSLAVAIAAFWWFVQSSRDRSSSTSQAVVANRDTADQDGQDRDLATQDDDSPPSIPATEDGLQSEGDTSDQEQDAADIPGNADRIDADSNDQTITTPPSDLIPRSPLDPPSSVPVPPSPQTPTDSADEPTDRAGAQELPPELEQYTKFLLEAGSAEKTTLQAPPTMDEVTIEAAADEVDDPTITVRPKEVNLKADLAIRMAIDTEGYPLPDLVLLVGQITGVPIQIDWVSFDLAGVDLSTPVVPPKGWQTAKEILDAAAARLGAELRDEETLIMITLTDEAFDQQLASIADLSDFGDHESSAKQVLIDFLRGEGEEAGKEVPLGLSRDDRQISAISVDALRRMRGIKPKVADDRMHRWAWCSNDSSGEWTPLTGGEAIAQVDTPICMADFLRRMAHQNGTSNLINWYDFVRRGVAPERVMLPHSESDAGTTMERVLKPLGLQVRQVDATHWWLGREPTYDRLPVIVWTPPLGDQRDQFIKELSNVMSGTSRDVFRVTIDPDSDRAIMLLPRFIVRQLAKLADGVAASKQAT